MSFILNGSTLPVPNSFTDNPEVIGAYTQTMLGGRRRAIRAVKHTYVLGYTRLTQTEYNQIKTIFDLRTSVSFVNSDLGIDTTVFVDISPREFLAGNASLLSSLEVTLTEE